jgi:hypothetical protein
VAGEKDSKADERESAATSSIKTAILIFTTTLLKMKREDHI